MKITAQQSIELLKALGVATAELVEAEGDSEYDRDAAITSIDNSRLDILKPRITEQLRPEIERSISGMQGSKLSKWLVQHTGIDKKVFADGMGDEEKVKLAIAHLNSTRDAGAQDVLAQIEEVRKNVIAEKDKEVNDWRSKHDEVAAKYIRRDTIDALEKFLSDKPIKGDRKTAAEDLYEMAMKDYAVKYNEETKTIGFYQKDKPELPAMNAANTMPLDMTEYAKGKFEPRGNWATNTSHVNPANAMRNATQQPGGTTPSPTRPTNDPRGRLQEALKANAEQVLSTP